MEERHVAHFVGIGTNFTKADTATRSRFAVTKPMADKIYKKALSIGVKDLVVLCTCNRSEFYGCCEPSALKDLIVDALSISDEDFRLYFYMLADMDAVRHFFKVVSGLDSQIVGDYEIVSQVKAALDDSRKYGLVGTITDRVSNFAFQAAKKIKSHTNLSSGKYSVSYAASELIAYNHNSKVDHILVIGTGRFGSTVARNLRHYFPKIQLSVTNRTFEKAAMLAGEIKANVISYKSVIQQLHLFDAVITTINEDTYLIRPEHIRPEGMKIFLDLSVPQAIDPAVKHVQGVTLYTVDEVSSFHNDLITHRYLEIPRAEKIVEVFIQRFMEWHQVNCYSDIMSYYKEKIHNLLYGHQQGPDLLDDPDHSKKIEKSFSELFLQIREQGYAGCTLIETINNLVPKDK